MTGRRRALIVAIDEYQHAELSRLPSAAADAEALARVLGDPGIGRFDVQILRNEQAHRVREEVEDFFAEGTPEDLLLMHFSGHGLKSDAGELFFSAGNTRPTRLRSTAVPSDFVLQCMRTSRSRSIVLLLDCCYGGASEFAFEGDRLTDRADEQPSVFTGALVQGLITGDADRDEDGWIALGELYEYVFERVRAVRPQQTPTRGGKMQGELYLARSPRRRVRPQPIPPDLREALTDGSMYARIGAITELRKLVLSDNLAVAAGAVEALAGIRDADITHVAEQAREALGVTVPSPAVSSVSFGEVAQGGPAPHRRVELAGAPIARACMARSSDERVLARVDGDLLDVWIDTAAAGPVSAVVALAAVGGEAGVAVSATVTLPQASAAPAASRAAVPAQPPPPAAAQPSASPKTPSRPTPNAGAPADRSEFGTPWSVGAPGGTTLLTSLARNRWTAIAVCLLFIAAVTPVLVRLAVSGPPSSQASDSKPLTVAELFGASTITDPDGGQYRVQETDSSADCTRLGGDDLDRALAPAGCTQFVRGTVATADGNLLATAGVANLASTEAAKTARTALGTPDAPFAVLATTTSTQAMKGSQVPYWTTYGHFLVFCVIVHGDGSPVRDGQPDVDAVRNGLLHRYLIDTVLTARDR